MPVGGGRRAALLLLLAASSVCAFSCGDGRRIPDAWVDDDYCDCGDDEPHTSACAGQSAAAVFRCENKGHKPLVIPSSRVDDLICDCCDCTDERAAHRGRDRCAEVARAEAEAHAAQDAALERGYSVRLKLGAKGAKKRKKLQKRLKKKREALERATAALKERKKKRKAARRAAAERALNATAEEFDWGALLGADDGMVAVDAGGGGAANGTANGTVEAAEAAYNATRDKKKRLKAKVEALQMLLMTDFGRELEFLPMQGKCYTLVEGGYIYTFCPFVKLTQGKVGEADVLLGKWKEWESKYDKQSYTEGQTCWQGPERRARVRVVCGGHNRLVKVHEPEKCAYEALFEAPAACSKNPYKNKASVDKPQPRKVKYDHPHAHHNTYL